jgi:hypothetical protein
MTKCNIKFISLHVLITIFKVSKKMCVTSYPAFMRTSQAFMRTSQEGSYLIGQKKKDKRDKKTVARKQ